MVLSSFQVKNYRSILNADFPLSKVTVLLGKNNEGKSNILRALTVAMGILEKHSIARTPIVRYTDSSYHYQWEKDYPKDLQVGGKSKIEDRVTVFTLHFQLDDIEIESFKREIGHSLNGDLPIQIKIGPDCRPRIKVIKSGKGSKPLNEKSQRIANYISRLIRCNYIAAVRTREDCYRIVDRLVQDELDKLSERKDYKEALSVIEKMREPVLASISNSIRDVLLTFLPSIKGVSIDVNGSRSFRNRFLETQIRIDDGQKTELESKGDGVISLVTLGLLQNQWKRGGASIVAIEEPESHLHPEAINRLRETIYSLAVNNQVVITTHNPLFVNRENPLSNIIVDNGKATVARSVRSIRDVLGVKISDNLFDAKLAVLVEGVTDEQSLKAILSSRSFRIERAIKDNNLVFLPLKGVKNLGYYVNMFRSLVASFYCVLDNDNASQQEVLLSTRNKTLMPNEYTMVAVSGYVREIELEDTYDISLYSSYLNSTYGVNVSAGIFKRKDKKWSDRLESLFRSYGKMYDKNIEETIKYEIARMVVDNNGKNIIVKEAEPFFANLVLEIETRI